MSVEVRAENTTSLASVKAIYDATRRAKQSADEAEGHAQEALRQAGLAQDSADKANRQAIYATNYANNALSQLGTVESVVDTLSWITDHSAFVATTDTSVVSGKTYYLPCNNVLTIADGTTETNGLTFIYKDGIVTINGTATADTTVSVGTPSGNAGDTIYISGITGGSASTYMLRYAGGGATVNLYEGVCKTTKVSGSGETLRIVVLNGTVMEEVVMTPTVSTANEDFEYTIVDNPTGNPLTQGYFELDTDEAVKTYVKAHLSLTNDGLYILNDASAYKMLLANNGMYIQAPNGTAVNQSTADGNIIRATDGTVIAHLGYGEGTAQSGTATKPYFTLGNRKITNTAYDANSTYNVGDMCVYNGEMYVCTTNISTPEAWDQSHWVLSIGNLSYAEGHETLASGYASHAEGEWTKAIGHFSHAEGYISSATGQEAHAENTGTAIGLRSHAEGRGTAWGDYSHAEGYLTYANADYSHASGYGVTTSSNQGDAGQCCVGRFNNGNSGQAFIVGNGTSANARSDALTVDWSGNVDIPSGAKYKINGSNLSASDVGALPTSGGTMTGQLLTSYKTSVAMGSYGSAQTTVPNFIDEVRMSSGCCGSVSIGTAYTKNGVTINAGWYNFMYMPHRSGGVNGSASGDNCNYGNCFLFGMNNTYGRFIVRVSSGTIAEVAQIYTSIERYTRSNAGTLDWSSQADGDAKVIMKSALAFWNGAYNGTGSNLKYSANGEIIGTNTGIGKTTWTPTSGSSYSSYGGCYYEKYGRVVHVHVGVSGLTTGTSTNIYTLPSSHRPSSPVYAHGTGGAWNNIGYLEISTAGVVTVRSQGTYCGADITYLV